MNTLFVGIKEFRQNIAGFVKKARARKTRYIVMNRNVPLFEVTPFNKKENLSTLFEGIERARDDVRRGKVYAQKEILKEFT